MTLPNFNQNENSSCQYWYHFFQNDSIGLVTTVICCFNGTSGMEEALLGQPGNTKGGSITVPLTSCLTSLDKSVLQIKTKFVS
jgi:hypothetical protein